MGHIIKCNYGSVPASLSDAKGCLAVDVQEYATAQDMMQSTCLKLGYAHTLGFYEVGDGGAAYYTVVAQATGDSPNGMDVLGCRKGLVAELMQGKDVNLLQMGAKPTVDCTAQMNRFDKAKRLVLTSDITFSGNIEYGSYPIRIEGNGNTVSYTGSGNALTSTAQRHDITNVYFYGNKKLDLY